MHSFSSGREILIFRVTLISFEIGNIGLFLFLKATLFFMMVVWSLILSMISSVLDFYGLPSGPDRIAQVFFYGCLLASIIRVICHAFRGKIPKNLTCDYGYLKKNGRTLGGVE